MCCNCVDIPEQLLIVCPTRSFIQGFLYVEAGSSSVTTTSPKLRVGIVQASQGILLLDLGIDASSGAKSHGIFNLNWWGPIRDSWQRIVYKVVFLDCRCLANVLLNPFNLRRLLLARKIVLNKLPLQLLKKRSSTSGCRRIDIVICHPVSISRLLRLQSQSQTDNCRADEEMFQIHNGGFRHKG